MNPKIGVAQKGTVLYDRALDSINKIYIETYGFTTKTLAQEFVYLGDENKIIGAVGLSRLEENSPKGYLELFLTCDFN